MPAELEQVALLLAKAAEDEYVLDRLVDDPEAPESVFGFHAQQATEKLLKAALTHAGVVYPFTHRLVELIDLATERGVELPVVFEDLRELTPFAVEFRYGVVPPDGDDEALDKSSVRDAIRRARKWTEEFVGK
jgi:HEPN domain-containing protein